jgi:cytochrome oxidase Cu insertion factor (SCO1/SenC/PrrC family)
MEGITRRKALAAIGSVPLVAGVGALAARGHGLFAAHTQPRFQPVAASGSQSARAMLQRKHLLNLPLVTQDGKTVRFYDDLVKDKKVVLTFIDTGIQPESNKVSQNLATLQQFFGSRVGKDIHLYTITQNPQQDTPEVLKTWAAQYGAGPGWTFLTGNPTNVEALRQSLGFASEFAEDNANPAFSIGVLRYGTEPEMRWAHCQSQSSPRVLAHSLLLDFGTDPAALAPPPVWNCSRLVAGLPA